MIQERLPGVIGHLPLPSDQRTAAAIRDGLESEPRAGDDRSDARPAALLERGPRHQELGRADG
jgi:hypothetical protein